VGVGGEDVGADVPQGVEDGEDAEGAQGELGDEVGAPAAEASTPRVVPSAKRKPKPSMGRTQSRVVRPSRAASTFTARRAPSGVRAARSSTAPASSEPR